MREAIPLLKAARPGDDFTGLEESVHTDYMDDELSDVEMDLDMKVECDRLRCVAGVGEKAWVKRRSACLSKQVSNKGSCCESLLLTVLFRDVWCTVFCRNIRVCSEKQNATKH
jgi:hypothetical protein